MLSHCREGSRDHSPNRPEHLSRLYVSFHMEALASPAPARWLLASQPSHLDIVASSIIDHCDIVRAHTMSWQALLQGSLLNQQQTSLISIQVVRSSERPSLGDRSTMGSGIPIFSSNLLEPNFSEAGPPDFFVLYGDNSQYAFDCHIKLLVRVSTFFQKEYGDDLKVSAFPLILQPR
jgi:hypothetical protein